MSNSQSSRATRVSKIVLRFFGAILGLYCAAPCVQAQEPSSTETAVGAKVAEYAQQGRYDDAVHAGLDSLQGTPSDSFILRQVATVYVIRTGRNPKSDSRQEWLRQAVAYTDKALSMGADPKDVSALYQSARIFEEVGDLSSSDKCSSYSRALKLAQGWIDSLATTDNISFDGKIFPTAPLRQQGEMMKDRVKKKSMVSACKLDEAK